MSFRQKTNEFAIEPPLKETLSFVNVSGRSQGSGPASPSRSSQVAQEVSSLGNDAILLSPELTTLWHTLQHKIPSTYLSQYIAALNRSFCDTCEAIAYLSHEEMKDLGIEIGHRRVLASTAAAIAGVTPHHREPGGRKKSFALAKQLQKVQSDMAAQKAEIGGAFSESFFGDHNVERSGGEQKGSPTRFRRRSSTNAGDVEWVALSGQRPNLRMFLEEMHTLRTESGFPNSFDRLFYDNKPMPFVEVSQDKSMFALLLRIPDLTDEDGTTIGTITNRVCMLVNRDTGLIVTYHACEEDPFDGFQAEWESGRHLKSSVEKVAETMIRRVLKTYHKGLMALRETVDALEDRGDDVKGDAAETTDDEENGGKSSEHIRISKLDDISKVQKFFLVGKKASVYKRCADGSKEALSDLADIDWMEAYVKTLCDSLSSVGQMSDELSVNSFSSIDMIIALSDFKSSQNLRTFTYLSIFFQPVMLATGWYGMNWDNMPELMFENGYFVFTALVWVAAFVFILKFLYFNELWNAATRIHQIGFVGWLGEVFPSFLCCRRSRPQTDSSEHSPPPSTVRGHDSSDHSFHAGDQMGSSFNPTPPLSSNGSVVMAKHASFQKQLKQASSKSGMLDVDTKKQWRKTSVRIQEAPQTSDVKYRIATDDSAGEAKRKSEVRPFAEDFSVSSEDEEDEEDEESTEEEASEDEDSLPPPPQRRSSDGGAERRSSSFKLNTMSSTGATQGVGATVGRRGRKLRRRKQQEIKKDVIKS